MQDWNQLLQVLSSTVLTSQIENDVFCFVFKSPSKLKIFSSKTRIEFIKVLAFSNPYKGPRLLAREPRSEYVTRGRTYKLVSKHVEANNARRYDVTINTNKQI